MINILFVHSSSELYGSDLSLLNIVKNINKLQFSVFVILPCLGPLVYEMEKIEGVKVEIFDVAVLRRKNISLKGGCIYLKQIVTSIIYIKKYIKEYNINIVDTNTAVVFSGAIAAKICKIKSVWHIREIIKNNMENKFISFIMNHYADIIIANSMATGKMLKVNQDKIRVVYNAVESKTKIEKVAHQKPTVGMAGRINRWKGQKLFVDAAEIVHKFIPSVEFEIAGETYLGEDYLKEELLEYIAEKKLNKVVRLLGQVNNMDAFYGGIDVFVLPSIKPEPFGLVVIEAMEYAIPVIATNHGGPVEIITDRIDGYLVDYKTADQMATRIIELLQNKELCDSIGINGQKKKRKEFLVSEMVRKIENVFKEILNENEVN